MSSLPTLDAMDDVLPTNQHSGETTAIDTPAPTTLEIVCLVLGEEAPFIVTIAQNQRVGDLKNAIHKKIQSLSFTDAHLLDLYLLDVPDDDGLLRAVKDMQKQGKFESPLRVTKRLFKVFPTALKDDIVHILVKAPEPAPEPEPFPRGTKRKNEEDPEEERSRKLKTRLPAPSAGGAPDIFKQWALPGPHQIFKCNRPIDITTIPLALLHEVFAKFLDDCNSFEPTAKETNFVQTLQFEMANFFRTEGDRQHKFNECFANHYQTRLLSLPIGGTKATTDGHIFEIVSATSNWVIMIAEAKNELAGTRADPRFQALLYYQNQIKTYPDNMFDTCCFPAIIITYYAAKLEFSGVLSHPNGIIQSEILTTTLPLDADWRNSEIQMAIAKIAGALENALAGLSAYYKAFNRPAPSMPIKYLPFHFPYQNSYLDSELGHPISFTYTQRPFEDRLIFLGKELEGSKRQIMIKFTRTYSSTVHKELAGLGYAPALHGLQRLPGGWYMVVMEYLDESEDWMMLYDLPPQLRDGFRPTINTVVDHLHKKRYVHGDIRVGNLFANRKSGTVKFLDFDEAGVAGEAKYPMNWNTTTVNRSHGAYGGQLITQEHDLFMVEELFKGEYSGRPLDRSIIIPKATP